MENKLEISMGVFQPPITKQLSAQSLPFDKDIGYCFDLCKTSMGHLIMGGIITDSERKKFEKKLFDRIAKHVNEQLEKTK